jgi:hypothetical protein
MMLHKHVTGLALVSKYATDSGVISIEEPLGQAASTLVLGHATFGPTTVVSRLAKPGLCDRGCNLKE